MNEIERAETGTRVRPTAEDRRRYDGIAQHPLGRRWLMRRLVEAQQGARRAEASGDAATEERHRLEIRRVQGEAKRLGVNLEGLGDG